MGAQLAPRKGHDASQILYPACYIEVFCLGIVVCGLDRTSSCSTVACCRRPWPKLVTNKGTPKRQHAKTHLLRRHVSQRRLKPLEALGGPLQALQRRHRSLGRLFAVERGVAVRLDAVHPESTFQDGCFGLFFQQLFWFGSSGIHEHPAGGTAKENERGMGGVVFGTRVTCSRTCIRVHVHLRRGINLIKHELNKGCRLNTDIHIPFDKYSRKHYEDILRTQNTNHGSTMHQSTSGCVLILCDATFCTKLRDSVGGSRGTTPSAGQNHANIK